MCLVIPGRVVPLVDVETAVRAVTDEARSREAMEGLQVMGRPRAADPGPVERHG